MDYKIHHSKENRSRKMEFHQPVRRRSGPVKIEFRANEHEDEGAFRFGYVMTFMCCGAFGGVLLIEKRALVHGFQHQNKDWSMELYCSKIAATDEMPTSPSLLTERCRRLIGI
ncbi:uncharacterized protein LOC127130324 [Lathyrus oleraceus]|uniref:uncharacterized protein LOC127130324 n=1 Tax=Pisum sativum TaxID=3888 RepID=UPI0021D0D040|nr:uncharacterized protein LOC127130324 [Pisum sativum]